MALCASTVSPSGNAPYFPLIQFGNLQAPIVNPLPGNDAAALEIYNGLPPVALDTMKAVHYVTNTTGGGLLAGHYQAYLYGLQVGGNNIAPLFDGYGNGNNDAIFRCNIGIPLDVTRIGTTTGTGAPVAVACPSVTSGSSFVGASFVGGALPAAAPVIVVTTGVGFTINATAGSIYNYVVFG